MLHHNECVMRLFHINVIWIRKSKRQNIVPIKTKSMAFYINCLKRAHTHTQFIINIHHHTLNIITVVAWRSTYRWIRGGSVLDQVKTSGISFHMLNTYCTWKTAKVPQSHILLMIKLYLYWAPALLDGKQTGAPRRVCVRSKAEKGKVVLLLQFWCFPPLIKPKRVDGKWEKTLPKDKTQS